MLFGRKENVLHQFYFCVCPKDPLFVHHTNSWLEQNLFQLDADLSMVGWQSGATQAICFDGYEPVQQNILKREFAYNAISFK